MRILLLVIIIFILNSKVIGQEAFSEKHNSILNNLLLEGNIDSVENYIKIEDSLFSIRSIFLSFPQKQEYYKNRDKYLVLIKRIKIIANKPLEEIIDHYSLFISPNFGYEKKIISDNALLTFNKFKQHFNNKEYIEAVKYINITFFFNFEEQLLNLNRFAKVMSEFSKELSSFETSIDCGDLENSITLETLLDSLSILLPDSAKVNRNKYLSLKEKLGEQKEKENILICSIEDYSKPIFSIRLAPILDYSSELDINLNKHTWMEEDKQKTYYSLFSNVGLGLSLSLHYNLFTTFSVGLEYTYVKYYYSYVGVFTGIYNGSEVEKLSKDLYGYYDFRVKEESYNIYVQYKFANRSIFHPFIRLAYGKIDRTQSLATQKDYNASKSYYTIINTGNWKYNQTMIGGGLEIQRFISNKVDISVLYLAKFRPNDIELSRNFSGIIELIVGYNW